MESWEYNTEDLALYAKYNRIVDIANWIVDNGSSLRQISREFLVPRSTVSLHIDKYLKHLDSDLYVQVKVILNYHKKHSVSGFLGRY